MECPHCKEEIHVLTSTMSGDPILPKYMRDLEERRNRVVAVEEALAVSTARTLSRSSLSDEEDLQDIDIPDVFAPEKAWMKKMWKLIFSWRP